MRKYLFTLSLIPFLLFSYNAFAQVTVKGVVKDILTENVMDEANVVINPGNHGASTNDKGEFTINNINPGNYTLEVSFIGYTKYVKEISVVAGRTNYYTVFMTNSPYVIDPFVFVEKTPTPISHVETKILQSELQSESVRDIGDQLRKVPNVSGVRKGGIAVDPVVRGFKFDQLNVHLDGGIRVEGGCPNRMDPVASHVEVDDIANIEIIKGPYVLRYGPTLGGLVNLVTTRPYAFTSKKFEVHARAIKGYESNWNGDKEHIMVTGGNNKVFFNVTGSRMDYGNYKDGNGDMVRSKFFRYGYSAELGFRPKENHEILLTWNESRGRDVYFSALPMDERIDNTTIMSVDYKAKNLGKHINSLNIKMYQSDVEHVMDNKEKPFSDTVAAVSAIDALNTGGRAEVGLIMGEHGHMFVGTDFEIINKDGDRYKVFYRMNPTPKGVPEFYEPLWSNAQINNNGVFAEYKATFGTINLLAAARVDINRATSDDMLLYNPNGMIVKDTLADVESNYTNFSASFGITKNINEYLAVGLGLGRGVRSPNMVERYIKLLPVGFDKYEYLGNPQLKPEVNHQADLNIRFTKDEIGEFYINGFYSIVYDYINGRKIGGIMPNTNSVLGVKEFYNAPEVHLRGFEFSYITPNTYNLGAQIIAAYTRGTMIKAWDVNVEIDDDPLNEVPPFEANFMIHYKMFDGKFVPKFNIRAVSKQDYVSVAYDEQTTPAFTIMDFRFTYNFSNMITLAGGINNITDLAYYEHLNRRIIGSGANMYEPGRSFFVNMIVKI
jgi:iron complex outermembrane receptor protein